MIIYMFSNKRNILLIIFIGLLVYFNTLFNGFILGDDYDQLLSNPLVHSVQNIPKLFTGSTYYQEQTQLEYGLYYRPLMLIVFTIVNSIFGLDSLIFHFLQIVIHLTNALLIYLVFKKIVSEKLALITSLVFMVHPINSESVLHVSSIQEPMYLFFGMLAFYYFVRITKIKFVDMLVLDLLLLFSVLAKETGLAFLGILIIYSWLFDRGKIRFLIFVSISIFVVYSGLRFGLAKVSFGDESIAQIAHVSLINRLINIPKIILEYIITFIFPLNLKLAQFWLIKQLNFIDFWRPLGLLIGLILGLVITGRKIYYRQHKVGKIYLFFSAWFIIGMLPHLQIIPLDATWSERWFYLSSIGLIVMVGIIGEFWLIRIPSNISWLFMVLLLSLLSMRTIIRTGNWRDSQTLFEHDIKVSSGNYFLQNNIGTVYINDKKYSQAKSLIEASVTAYPYFGNLNNLAIIYMNEKNLNKADEYFRKALIINTSFQVYRNYSNFLLYVVKDYKKTEQLTATGLAFYPNSGLLWLAYAQAQYYLGNQEKALQAARKAYEIEPFDMSLEVLTAIKEKRKINIEKYLQN